MNHQLLLDKPRTPFNRRRNTLVTEFWIISTQLQKLFPQYLNNNFRELTIIRMGLNLGIIYDEPEPIEQLKYIYKY